MNAKYKKYLASPEWKGRKERWFRSRPGCCCEVCGSSKKIILHHLTYARVGKERDSDLMPLCNGCHLKLHRYARSRRGQSLYQSSVEYVALRSTKDKATNGNMLSYKLNAQRKRNHERRRSNRRTS